MRSRQYFQFVAGRADCALPFVLGKRAFQRPKVGSSRMCCPFPDAMASGGGKTVAGMIPMRVTGSAIIDILEAIGNIEEHAAKGKEAFLREKLIKIGAKVVRHGRYLTFQLAEVAVPRALFEKILGLIRGLRPLAQPT